MDIVHSESASTAAPDTRLMTARMIPVVEHEEVQVMEVFNQLWFHRPDLAYFISLFSPAQEPYIDPIRSPEEIILSGSRV